MHIRLSVRSHILFVRVAFDSVFHKKGYLYDTLGVRMTKALCHQAIRVTSQEDLSHGQVLLQELVVKDALNALSLAPSLGPGLGPPHHLRGRYPTGPGLGPHSSDLGGDHLEYLVAI